MSLHLRAVSVLLMWFIAGPTVAQDPAENLTVYDILITLKDGSMIVIGENDKYEIGYDATSTIVSVKKEDSPRAVRYDASKIESMIFSRNGITDTCISRQVDKKNWVILSTLVMGEKASLYTSPDFGSFRFHYIQKAGSPFCIPVSNLATQFPKSLKDCPDVVNFYLSKKKSNAAESAPLPDIKLIEIMGVYNTCGQSNTLN
jgi:hypothetical protein